MVSVEPIISRYLAAYPQSGSAVVSENGNLSRAQNAHGSTGLLV